MIPSASKAVFDYIIAVFKRKICGCGASECVDVGRSASELDGPPLAAAESTI